MAYKRLLLLLAAAGLPVLSTQTARAEGDPPGTPALARGVLLRLETRSREVPRGFLRRDARAARLVALYVSEGEAPSPFLPPGPFRAVWEGRLMVDLLDDYTFSLEGRGTVEVEIDGKTVIPRASGDLGRVEPVTVELDEGPRKIAVRYESPPSGPSWLRLLWSSYDFAPEPIHPSRLKHDPEDPELRSRALVRRGRELVAERLCLRCHRPRRSAGLDAMPELARSPPSFDGMGGRLKAAWIAAWIRNPRALREDATMPRLLPSEGDDDKLRDIVAALSAGEVPPDAGVESRNPAQGRALFEKLGCAGCHVTEPLGGRTFDELGRRTLAGARAKWRADALKDYLLAPAHRYPSNPMPDFRLEEEEAAALAAYVLSLGPRAAETPAAARIGGPHGDPERGRKLLSELGCLACHGRSEAERQPPPGARPLEEVLREDRARDGCLASDPARRGRAPDFGFTAAELEALRALAREGSASLYRRSAVEYAERTIRRLRCTACHRRDGELDLLSRVEGDGAAPAGLGPAAGGSESGRLYQLRPDLTWAGEKLRTDWLARFLEGDFTERVRPWLDVRMPVFALDGALFARGLVHEHGLPAEEPEEPAPDPAAARVGEELLARAQQGLSCITCHDWGGRKAQGTFDAKGPNLDLLVPRLRKRFYLRWMLDPLRVDPQTKMPKFAVDGKTPLVEYFEGDARRQYEAIWARLRLGAPPGGGR